MTASDARAAGSGVSGSPGQAEATASSPSLPPPAPSLRDGGLNILGMNPGGAAAAGDVPAWAAEVQVSQTRVLDL